MCVGWHHSACDPVGPHERSFMAGISMPWFQFRGGLPVVDLAGLLDLFCEFLYRDQGMEIPAIIPKLLLCGPMGGHTMSDGSPCTLPWRWQWDTRRKFENNFCFHSQRVERQFSIMNRGRNSGSPIARGYQILLWATRKKSLCSPLGYQTLWLTRILMCSFALNRKIMELIKLLIKHYWSLLMVKRAAKYFFCL